MVFSNAKGMQKTGQNTEQYMTDLFNRMMARNYWELLVKNEIITSPDHKFLYTAISKTACTQIKYILADLLRYPDKFDRNLSPHDLKNTGLISVSSLQDMDKAYRLMFSDDVFRFVFVRNPLSRLLSAFANKLQLNFNTLWEQERRARLENIYTDLVVRIKSRVTGVTEQTIDIYRNPLTFREFVYFIVDQDPYEMDRHWYPQNRAMFYDVINYHFIGKVENFDNDFKNVLQKINAPVNIYDFTERQNASLRSLPLSNFYDSELEKLVVKKYEEDFDLFKYPKYQVRPFQSVYIDDRDAEAVTYYKKINSIEATDATKEVGVLIQTKDNYSGVRNTIKSIREQLGPRINIYVGVRGEKEKVYDDLSRYYNATVYHFEGLNIAETFNQLVKMVDEPYLLNLTDNMIVIPGFELQSALKILKSDDKIKIIGGLEDCTLDPDNKEESKLQQNNSNIIFYDKVIGILILMPLSYYDNQRFYVDNKDYAYCDTIGKVFLVDKKIFTENNLWFDDKMIDIYHILIDFCLRVMDLEDINIVESTCLNVEVHRNNTDYLNSLGLTIKDTVEFFSKWGIIQFQIIGKLVQELNKENGFIYEYPFKYLNCLGELKDGDNFNMRDDQKIILLDKEISNLQKELHDLRNSLSWKMTKPFRKISQKLTNAFIKLPS